MGLSQNCWREGETRARKTLELITDNRQRAVRATVSNRSFGERLRAGRIFNLKTNLAVDWLQIQPGAIGDTIYGSRKPTSRAGSKAIWGRKRRFDFRLFMPSGGDLVNS